MAASSSLVTPAEAYAVWGERIRCLFSAPPSFIETALQHSPFERHSYPTAAAWDLSTPVTSGLRANVGGGSSTDPAAYFSDAELFPLCFYARLLQTENKAAASVPTNAGIDVSPERGSRSTAQRPVAELRVDEDALASRLASQLRARTRANATRTQQRAAETTPLVSSFCDPKVEEQQARLHGELTEFLMEVREHNRASAELRHQLLRSRVLRGRERVEGLESESMPTER